MKKLIVIVIASMMFANIGFAEVRLIEKTKVGDHRIYTWCVDGYKFVVVDKKHREASSLVQFMRRNNNESVPVEC